MQNITAQLKNPHERFFLTAQSAKTLITKAVLGLTLLTALVSGGLAIGGCDKGEAPPPTRTPYPTARFVTVTPNGTERMTTPATPEMTTRLPGVRAEILQEP